MKVYCVMDGVELVEVCATEEIAQIELFRYIRMGYSQRRFHIRIREVKGS